MARIPIQISLAVVLGLVVSSAAHAEGGDRVRIEATGEAREGDDTARTRAIDDAFARALEQFLSEELTRTQRRRHAKALRQRIVRRARLFVAAFGVEEESVVEGRLRVRVAAQIDRAKVRTVLEEIGIEDRSGGGASRSRPAVALLMHATIGDKTTTSFGESGGDGGIAGRRFARELGERGFRLADATGVAAPVSRDPAAGLPVDDRGAAALCRTIGAGGAFVVGISLGDRGTIRGTRLFGAESVARVRVVAESGKLVGKSETRGAGFAETVPGAAAAAARDAAAQAAIAVLPAAERFWPAPRATDDAMQVVVRGAHTWAAIEAVVAQLASSRGVSRVNIRRVRSGEVALAVDTTMKSAQIAAVVSATRLAEGNLSATSRGQAAVEAVVRTDQPDS